MTREKIEIPKGWREVRLEEVCKVNQGLQIPISKRSKRSTSSNKIYLTLQYLNGKSEAEYIDDYSKSVTCVKGDILMTRTGNTGIVVTGIEGVFHNNFFKVNCFSSIDSKYIYRVLKTPKVQFKILTLAGLSTIPDLNHGDFYSIKILLPPLHEQEAIVRVLETWDKAIEKIERKIQIKKQIKKGLMQKFFSRTTEGTENTEEWKTVKLGEVCDIKKGKGLAKSKVTANGKNKCILYGEIYTTYSEVISNVVSKTDNEEGLRSKIGDVLIPSSTTTSAIDLAVATTILENNILLGGDINVLRPNRQLVSSIFISYFLTNGCNIMLAKLAQGVTIIHLYGKDLEKLKILLPPLPVQEAIAEVLMTADKEIEALEKKKELWQEQKKFLLNQLITGEIRTTEGTEGTERKREKENEFDI